MCRGKTYENLESEVDMESRKSSFGVVFYIRKRPNERGECPIYARITVDGKRSMTIVLTFGMVEHCPKGLIQRH
ncbi:Arm DNA-binding domain-containing protein [Olivibacter sitiensis]|uniref:Arm DNA-binding domain-containing protein n=1 Tax=Olivibacter sitiensis TaxID=376470 RepID=UPI003CCBC1EE